MVACLRMKWLNRERITESQESHRSEELKKTFTEGDGGRGKDFLLLHTPPPQLDLHTLH